MRLSHASGVVLAALAWGCAGQTIGPQVAAGPTFGYVFGRGVSAGWELGGGRVVPTKTWSDRSPTPSDFNLLERGSVGMSWRPGPSATGPRERIWYVA